MGVLRAAGRSSGKLASRERAEGEDEEGEVHSTASWNPAAGARTGGEEEEPELEGGRRGERHCDAPLLWKRSSCRRGGVPAGFSR